MFDAKGVDFEDITQEEACPLPTASGDARGFAVSGGVAHDVLAAIHAIEPGRNVKVAHAEGLEECRKMLLMAKAGKYDGYLLEGMACKGGCIGGAGTLQPVDSAKKQVEKAHAEAKISSATGSEFKRFLPLWRARE